MPQLILINGKPGVGKTTLLKRLKSELQVPALGKDDIKEFLFDTIGIENREWSRLVGAASADMLYDFARGFLGGGKSVIIENAFWAEYARPRYQALIQETRTEVLEFHCNTDEETRRLRNDQRIQNGERHPGHFDQQLEFDDTQDNKVYEPLRIGECIAVDTTRLDASGYDSLIAKARTFLQLHKEDIHG